MPTIDAPTFDETGKALSRKEQELKARRAGVCVDCGVQTHIKSMLRRQPVTNDVVYQGICLKCRLEEAPEQVRIEYQRHNPNMPAAVEAVGQNGSNRTRRAIASQSLTAGGVHRPAHRTAARSSVPTHNRPSGAAHGNHNRLSAPSTGSRTPAQGISGGNRHSTGMMPHNRAARTDRRQQRVIARASAPSAVGPPGNVPVRQTARPPPNAASIPPNAEQPAAAARPGIFSSDSEINLKNLVFRNNQEAAPNGHSSIDGSAHSHSTQPSNATGGSSLAPTRVPKVDYTFKHLNEDDKRDLCNALSDAHEFGDIEKMKVLLHYVQNLGMGRNEGTDIMIAEISDIVDQYRDDHIVLGLACSALLRLSASYDDLKIVIAHSGVLEVVLDSLRHDSHDQEFVEWALALTESLAIIPENKTLIIRQEGVISILDALKYHSKSARILFWSTRALYSLLYRTSSADEQEIRRILFAIEEADAIPILVGAINNSTSEEVVQLSAIRLLWRLQHNDDPTFTARIIKYLRDTSFVHAYIKITKKNFSSNIFTMATELLSCILAASDGDLALFLTASEAATPIVRIMKDYVKEQTVGQDDQDVVEASCRVLSILICGSSESRSAVVSVGGLQAMSDALKRFSQNESILESAVWALCHTLGDNRDTVITSELARTIKEVINGQVDDKLHLFQPLCSIVTNMCLIPDTTSADIFMSEINDMKLKIKEPEHLKDFEKATINFFIRFPDEITESSLDGYSATIVAMLHSPQGLDGNICSVLGAMSTKSVTIWKELTSTDSLTLILENLRASQSVETSDALLKFMIKLTATTHGKSINIPENMFPIILDVFKAHRSQKTIQLGCLALISDSLMITTSCPVLGNLVSVIIDCMCDNSVSVLSKIQACIIAWVITSRFNSKVDSTGLRRLFESLMSILVSMKEKRYAINYDLFLTATATLASVAAAMRVIPSTVSTEDLDELLTIPYSALELAPGKTEPYVRLLDCIYSLCWVDHDKVVQCGGVVVVIDTMAEFESSVAIQQFGCAILAILSAIETLQVTLSIVQTDGIDVIMNALRMHSTDTILRCQGVKALAHLSIDPESRMLISTLGGFDMIKNAMECNINDQELVKAGLSALLSLSADADLAVLSTADILPIVIETMNVFTRDANVQEFGMGVLQNLSMRVYDAKAQIAKIGGISAVANAIREFMGTPALVGRAFTTLWSLAVLDQNQRIITSTDSIPLVLNGMMLLLSDDNVILQGCGCLCTLAADSQNKSIIQNAGGVETLVYAMWAHHSSEDVQVESCRTLASLAVDSNTQEVIVAGEAEINAIANAMRRFPASENLQEQACLVLRNYLFSPENMDVMEGNASEIKSLVTRAAKNFPKACESRALQVLECMEEMP